MRYVLLTDKANATMLVLCPDEETADAVGAAAILGDDGVSAWRMPEVAVTNHHRVSELLRQGCNLTEIAMHREVLATVDVT